MEELHVTWRIFFLMCHSFILHIQSTHDSQKNTKHVRGVCNFSLIHHKLSRTQEIGEAHVDSPGCKRWCCHSQLLSKKCHLIMQKNNFQFPYKILILTAFSFVVRFSFEKGKRFACKIFAEKQLLVSL